MSQPEFIQCGECSKEITWIIFNRWGCPYCGYGRLHISAPAMSVEGALNHHKEHGDMDGHTCLLARCALHYPKPMKKYGG